MLNHSSPSFTMTFLDITQDEVNQIYDLNIQQHGVEQMKKRTASVLTLLALLACQPLTAHAGRITMQLTEQEETTYG